MSSCWGPTFSNYNHKPTDNSIQVHIHHHYHGNSSAPEASWTAARVNPSGSPYYSPGIRPIPTHTVFTPTPGFTQVTFVPVVQRTTPW